MYFMVIADYIVLMAEPHHYLSIEMDYHQTGRFRLALARGNTQVEAV